MNCLLTVGIDPGHSIKYREKNCWTEWNMKKPCGFLYSEPIHFFRKADWFLWYTAWYLQ